MPAYFSDTSNLIKNRETEEGKEDARRNDEDYNQKVDKAVCVAVKAYQKKVDALLKEVGAKQAVEDPLLKEVKACWKEVEACLKEVEACHLREHYDREGEDFHRSKETKLKVSDNILTATINDDRWNSVNIYCATLPKSGTVNIYATDPEVVRRPLLRIYSAKENKNSESRQADRKGYSSAGGQGNGFSKLEVISGMHPVDNEHFQHSEALMAIIYIENGHLYVQFHNWTEKFDLPFSTDCNSCIVVAFTGYSVKIVVE